MDEKDLAFCMLRGGIFSTNIDTNEMIVIHLNFIVTKTEVKESYKSENDKQMTNAD